MNDRKKNVAEAEQQLVSKPLLATSVERVMILKEVKARFRNLPQPKRFSSAISYLLSQVSVPLKEYDLIAGRCVDRELTVEEEKIFQEYLCESGGGRASGHFSLLGIALTHGIMWCRRDFQV